MQLLQRKPVKREMWWQRSKKGVVDELLKQMGISRSKQQSPGSAGKAPAQWLMLPTSSVG